MESFFNVKTSEEVLNIMMNFEPLGEEVLSVENALDRVLSSDIFSPEDMPGFYRSAMDGYAVKASSTFGAGESLPALLEISGEILMGLEPTMKLEDGQAFKISTGGMLPEGADGVVMIEYCSILDDRTLEVNRAISPLENVIQPWDDYKRGDCILRKEHILRPEDLGVLSGLGLLEVPVFRRPRVSIISTGDEVVPIEISPPPGKVRDINRYTLSAFCRQMGGIPDYVGLCADNFDTLKEMVEKSLAHSDMLWISGGSSVGTRDLTLKVFESLGQFELLVHGISISPGKPTIIGTSGRRPVIGLPGHVASALVVAEIFLAPLLLCLGGRKKIVNKPKPTVEAELTRNIESAGGREDYIRVKLHRRRDLLEAEPIFGKSGLISTLVEADGLLKIDRNTEGLYGGQRVEILLLDDKSGVLS
jgi:molybdopterin molybdotransferase